MGHAYLLASNTPERGWLFSLVVKMSAFHISLITWFQLSWEAVVMAQSNEFLLPTGKAWIDFLAPGLSPDPGPACSKYLGKCTSRWELSLSASQIKYPRTTSLCTLRVLISQFEKQKSKQFSYSQHLKLVNICSYNPILAFRIWRWDY